MSKTARQTIERALRILRITPAGQSPSAQEMDDALEIANNFLASWSKRGLTYTHATLALDDDVNLDDGLLDAFEYVLAGELEPEFGSTLTANAQKRVNDGWRLIEADLHDQEELTVDTGLRRMPSQFSNVGNTRTW